MYTSAAGAAAARSGSKLCLHPGCSKGAIGKLKLCIAHGGGKRCEAPGCHKAAQGQKPLCKAHGGGRRCKFPGCPRSARDRTDLCIGHGGGKRCAFVGAFVLAASPLPPPSKPGCIPVQWQVARRVRARGRPSARCTTAGSRTWRRNPGEAARPQYSRVKKFVPERRGGTESGNRSVKQEN